jgi:GR25 family glycosyltransferase involved in LPS biosynthesis
MKKKYCEKKTYHSLDQAKEAATTLKFKGRFENPRAYHCPNCWKYHLTTTGY